MMGNYKWEIQMKRAAEQKRITEHAHMTHMSMLIAEQRARHARPSSAGDLGNTHSRPPHRTHTAAHTNLMRLKQLVTRRRQFALQFTVRSVALRACDLSVRLQTIEALPQLGERLAPRGLSRETR
jgi:hypothetical protein